MIRLNLSAAGESDRAAIAEVTSRARDLGFSEARRHDVATAVAEAISNARRHGHAANPALPIEFSLQVDDHEIHITVGDTGPGLRALPPLPDLSSKLQGRDRPSGWGLYLIRSLANEVEFLSRSGGGLVVQMVFRNCAPEGPVTPVMSRDLPGGASVIDLPSRLEADLEEHLVPGVEAAMARGARTIVLDCGGVEFTSSAGVGVIVGVLRRVREQGVDLVLAGLHGQPERVLDHIALLPLVVRVADVEDFLGQRSRTEARPAGQTRPGEASPGGLRTGDPDTGQALADGPGISG